MVPIRCIVLLAKFFDVLLAGDGVLDTALVPAEKHGRAMQEATSNTIL